MSFESFPRTTWSASLVSHTWAHLYKSNTNPNPIHPPAGFAYAVSVYSPVAACPAGATTDKVSLVSTCIPKSNDTRAPSSEGSGCDDVPGTVSDAEWSVPIGQGSKIAGIPYLVTNAYGNAEGCDISSTTNAITQTIYAADQKCYAYEPGLFFKVDFLRSFFMVSLPDANI